MNIFINVIKNMRYIFFFLFSFFFLIQVSYAQMDDTVTSDSEVAQRYVIWIRQAIEEERWEEAFRALERASDFSDVNSDISYLYASMFIRMGFGKREESIPYLDTAIEVNRWHYYSEDDALKLKAQQLVAMRKYTSALIALEQIRESDMEAAILRLKAFRGIAVNTHGDTELASYRSLTLSAMNRFSRDSRPAKIFLEFLRGREVTASDQQIIDLIIRRLPILAEIDPELAWMASPYMHNLQDAQRFVAAYRAGGLSGTEARDFYPNPGSIPLALNYGLIDETTAVNELFSGARGINNPVLQLGILNHFLFDNDAVIDFKNINDVFKLLRNEEGRDLFTKSLYSFDGYVVIDSDNDGIIDQFIIFKNGAARNLAFDRNQNNVFDSVIEFDSNGIPIEAEIFDLNRNAITLVSWERYPSVKLVLTKDDDTETYEYFHFRPVDFNYAPVSFITIGGSRNRAGISFPVLSNQLELSRRTLILSCVTIQRLSAEFEEAIEIITLENGIPIKALECIGDKIISITEFENGFPVISYVDLDFDGRMETIRRFRRPGDGFPWPEPDEQFNYRKLIASQESDWTGEGKYKTREVYINDDFVVFEIDMDGTGEFNYSFRLQE